MFFDLLFGTARRAGRRSPPRRGPRLHLEALEDRLALNNRFVVPLDVPADNATTFHTLRQALTTTGLAAGDIIQIEKGSLPGNIKDADLPAVQNLTIRGNLAFPAGELPVFSNDDALGIDAAQQGLTLQNINLVLSGGGLTFNANGSLLRSQVVNTGVNGDAITLNQTSAAVLRDNVLVYQHAAAALRGMIRVNTAAGSQNLISGNTVSAIQAARLLTYEGQDTVADRVVDNTFIANEGNQAVPVLVVGAVNGLTIQGNSFRDRDFNGTAVGISAGAQNIQVLDNALDLPSGADPAIFVSSGGSGTTTSAILAGNRIATGPAGTGIFLFVGGAGSLSVKVEGNDFLLDQTGVLFNDGGQGGAFTIDMGGGTLGSAGGNNFRIFTANATSASGAIVVVSGPAGGTISAQNNLFRAGTNPEDVIFDHDDDNTRPDVVASSPVTGNAAFVQSLYEKFLHRVGDLNDPNDAGGWVNALNNGLSPATVANGVVRSTEALGIVVDGLYRRFLNRAADAAGRAAWVAFLQAGNTLESASTGFLTSPEYLTRFGSDVAFVHALYNQLLERQASDAEAQQWANAVASQGRAAVVNGILGSVEYRTLLVGRLYASLLKRTTPPSPDEVNGHVNSGVDTLGLLVVFAGSPEFQANS